MLFVAVFLRYFIYFCCVVVVVVVVDNCEVVSHGVSVSSGCVVKNSESSVSSGGHVVVSAVVDGVDVVDVVDVVIIDDDVTLY